MPTTCAPKKLAEPHEAPSKETDCNAKKTILYFYLHFRSYLRFHYGPEQPFFNPYEYRFLEILCRNHAVSIVFFTRSKYLKENRTRMLRGIAPEHAKWLILDDFPLPKGFPLLMRWPIETITRTLRIAFLLRTLRPDLIDGNWITRSTGLYCALARYHPFLATVWGDDVLIEPKRSRILRTLGRLTARTCDAIIVDSEVQRKAVLDLGCNPSKIYSFPWGIDLDRFKPIASTNLRKQLGWSNNSIVVSTRKHFPAYGIENLIKAIPSILHRISRVKFIIAGDGPLLEYHKALARESGVEHCVKFLGEVQNSELPSVLNAADVYVSTSYSDGTSASLLEAMACGLPVVVTRIPANQEWITQGENGFLARPGDVSALAQSVVSLLQDRQLRLRMGNANLELARRRADWRVNSLVFEKCISDLLLHQRQVTIIKDRSETDFVLPCDFNLG